MNDPVYNSISLTGAAASLTRALGIAPPKQAEPPIPLMDQLVKSLSSCGTVDRILMYNPDAVAMWLFQKYTDWYAPLLRHAQLTLPLRTVMPSVTPVCFGTMYTGAFPETHGIREYARPVIRIDTLFDAVLRAGKKAALIAVADSSMSIIFREREMDYFIYDTNEEVNRKALELIGRDGYDLLIVYNDDYDTNVHLHAPEGAETLDALKADIAEFDILANAVKENWKRHDTLIGFAPDHGCHEIEGGLGNHGTDMPEDLNILHFYGVVPKSE